MKRRKFLQSGSLLSIPLLLKGNSLTALSQSSLFSMIGGDTDRVLVLIQLNGGNDGLNTLIPLDQYQNLIQVRQNVMVPENSILPITDTLGLHPSMAGLKEVFDQGKLGIVQSVAYPNQNRSHFRSRDIWNTASDADQYLGSGWIGRYLDQDFSDYPSNYPNDDCPDPFAITMGLSISETCQGNAANYSVALNDPTGFTQLGETEGGEIDNSCYGQELEFVRESIRQSNAYATTIEEAYENGNNMVDYPDDKLSEQLQVIARLISGGLQTKIYVASLGGFDTHAAQVDFSDTTVGEHAILLQRLSDAILTFQNDLVALNVEERVVGMTYSEFGRRIRSNDSFGTDHGTAAPMFVFGSCVNSSVIGTNPEIDPDVANNVGVAMQYDFRSIYGSILIDWFGVEEDAVKNLLTPDFQYLPILESCVISNSNDLQLLNREVKIFPNPCRYETTLKFYTKDAQIKICLYDAIGSELKVLANQRFSEGKHQLQIDMRLYRTGNYVVRMQSSSEQVTRVFAKV